uniref:Putative 34 kDa salivary secreted protein n=1 Tax=Culex tarsalis TaxID=7177 RepID=A0A1Q3FC05_CULTA
MKSLKIVLALLILITNSISALPTEDSEPTGKKCQVSPEFLTELRNSITIAIKGSESSVIKLNTTGHGDCEDDLKAIVDSLAEIHQETVQIKSGGKTIDEVAELKDSFQRQIEQLTKERDVFELDFKQETLKKEGEMYDQIHKLKRSILDLKQHIREAEEEFYVLVIELVAHKIKQDAVTGKELNYASAIPPSKFGEFFRHVVEKHGFDSLLDAMYLLQYVYDPQDVFYEYMEEFEERPFSVTGENHKMVLTFLCWATNQEDKILRHIFIGCELYYLYNMTSHFLPTSNDGIQAVKLAEPVLKGMPETCLTKNVNLYMKEFTDVKNKEKYEALNKFDKCDEE